MLTFSELDARANQLAQALRDQILILGADLAQALVQDRLGLVEPVERLVGAGEIEIGVDERRINLQHIFRRRKLLPRP